MCFSNVPNVCFRCCVTFRNQEFVQTLKVKCPSIGVFQAVQDSWDFFYWNKMHFKIHVFSCNVLVPLQRLLFVPHFFGPIELTNSRYGLEDATFHQYSWRAASCQLALYCHLDLKMSCWKSIFRIIYLNEVIETSNFLSSQVVRSNLSIHLMMILAYVDVQKHIYLGIFTCIHSYIVCQPARILRDRYFGSLRIFRFYW